MTDAEFNRIFNLPFSEAEAFFKAKLNIPTNRWDDLWQEQHAKGFMVAGAAKADLLADFRTAINKSIAGGMTLKEFQAQFDTIVAKHGWSYNGGRNWRSALIYDTNVTTAYQAGRWRQFKEGGATHLMYKHADGVMNPRPHHVALHGTVRPIGDAFWKTHYPPNGWGCHCRAVIADASEQTGVPAAASDPKTIDKGWAYNVGEAMFKWQPNLDRYPFPVARGMVAELVEKDVFKRWHDFTAKQVAEELAKADFPKGLGKEGLISELRNRLTLDEKFPVAVLPDEVKSMIGANTSGVYLSHYDLVKQQVSRAGQDFGAMEYATAQSVIEDAVLVVREGDNISVFASDTNRSWYVAVLQTTQTGQGVFLKSFRKSNRKDVLAQKKKGSVLLDKLP